MRHKPSKKNPGRSGSRGSLSLLAAAPGERAQPLYLTAWPFIAMPLFLPVQPTPLFPPKHYTLRDALPVSSEHC